MEIIKKILRALLFVLLCAIAIVLWIFVTQEVARGSDRPRSVVHIVMYPINFETHYGSVVRSWYWTEDECRRGMLHYHEYMYRSGRMMVGCWPERVR